MADVIVIGGGVIGLSVAWRLQQAGCDTLLLERDRLGRGASWAAAGMLTPVSEAAPTEPELLELGLESLRQYPAFVEEVEAISGQPVDYDQTGTLLVALDADEGRQFRRLLDVQERLGLDASWLSSQEVLDREPMITPRVVGAITAPGDYQIDNRKLVGALTTCLEAAGGRVREEAPVEAIELEGLDELEGPAEAPEAFEKARVVGVRVDGERVSAGQVVVAAGCWSARLAGLPESLRPPVRPVRGQMVTLTSEPGQPLTSHVLRGRRVYCVPRPDGRLIVGATSEERGFDTSLTAGGIYELLRGVYEMLPGSYEVALTDLWAGLRPGSRDNLPIIGETPVRGLYYATGHYRSGILLTPVTSWAIAETVANGSTPPSMAPFAIDRFLET